MVNGGLSSDGGVRGGVADVECRGIRNVLGGNVGRLTRRSGENFDKKSLDHK